MFKTAWETLKQTFTEFSEDKVMRLAAALAYYTIFSLGPVLIIVISIAGLVWGGDAARGQLVAQFKGIAGEGGAQQIEAILKNANKPSQGVFAAIIGFVTLILGASGVFLQLKDSMNTVWGVKPKPGRGIMGTIRDRLFSFGMVVSIAFLLLATLAASTAIGALSKWMDHVLPVPAPVFAVLDLVVSTGIITLLFAAIFKWLPDVKISWRDVWMGAFATAVLFTLGKFALGMYLGRRSVASVYGAAGSLILILVWVYYSSIIFLFGAEFTQVYARGGGAEIEPSANAIPITPQARAEQGMSSDEKKESKKQSRQPSRQPIMARHSSATPADRLINGLAPALTAYLLDVVSDRTSRYIKRVTSDCFNSPRHQISERRLERSQRA